ncbi:MAG: methionine--tRNA ligase [Candidatus Absconditabacterales bacterium]|nr:methionine--tRNA ligase [Candidatus Absconditabacterales bacterium]
MSRFFLTTTLPYVNAQPHMGHALEFIQADFLARWLKFRYGADNVRFNVGTDEHGQKIRQKAHEAGLSVSDFVSQNVATFVDFCSSFGIGYDSFYRTSLLSHYPVAQTLRNEVKKNGLLGKKTYGGNYCLGCELFKKDKDLVNGECPDHPGQKLVQMEEENYFFLMSHLRDRLLAWFDAHPDFLYPKSKREELRNYLLDLEDLSISRRRETLNRGVPVPDDDDHVMYVWFDALSNYIGACGYPDPSFVDWRSQSIQFCGPDNLRFQGGIWQAMLEAIGAPHTYKLLVHGTVFGPDGNKMSKTLGNVISPFEMKNRYGVDAVRLYVLAGIPTYGNASFVPADMVALHNAWLCDTLGNLINRVLVLGKKYGTDLGDGTALTNQEWARAWADGEKVIEDAMGEYDLYRACHGIHTLGLWANKVFDNSKPRDRILSKEERTAILRDSYTVIVRLCQLYEPVIPAGMARCFGIVRGKEPQIPFVKIEGK